MAAEESFSEKVVDTYRACARVPAATRAHLFPSKDGLVEAEVTWTQREIERGKKISHNKSYFVERRPEGFKKLCVSSCQADVTNVVQVAPGHGGRVRKVLLVTDKASTAEPSQEAQQFIEVWTEAGLDKTLSVADIKDHGKINEDIHFGSFSLSADDKQLLYIAERKKPKAASYFSKPNSKEDPPPTKGAEHDYETNWGEQLSSVVNPVPVVLDLASDQVVVMDTAGVGDISAGQAVWVPGEEGGVVFIGWDNFPRKLGFVYCICRNSAVYHADAKTGKCTKLTDSDYNVYFPRFNPGGSLLVYFRAEAGGPHHTCAALIMMDWPSKTITTLVDEVPRPKSATDFPGFYNFSFPLRCWDSTGTRLLFHNPWGSVMEVTLVDTNTRTVSNVSGNHDKGAWLVLDVACDLVVAQFASLNTCPRLYIGEFPSNGDPVVWTELCSHDNPVTHGLTWERLYFSSGDDLSDLPYEGLLLLPASATPPPLVVFPHGGPHGISCAGFLVWPVCLAALGYAVLMVNYRGSTGFGQDSIYSLLGKVGTQDVQDVQGAARSVVERGVVDGGRVSVMGVSHGGFLGAHVIGQYPEFYKAAVLLNPVISLATMWSSTDIPDWCCVEGGLTFDPTIPPSGEQLATLHSMSPITLVKEVLAPVMLHIGGSDLRVPPSQGKLYYNCLKAQGKVARLLFYPKDCHPIMNVLTDADAFVNTACWLYQYCT